MKNLRELLRHYIGQVYMNGQANRTQKGEDRVRQTNTLAAMMPPLPIVVTCPMCGHQHVDRDERSKGGEDWTTKVHSSHLCARCGCIWRPMDTATVGVARLETMGTNDTWRPDTWRP